MSDRRFGSKFKAGSHEPRFRRSPVFRVFFLLLIAHCSPLTAAAQKLAFLFQEENSNNRVVIEEVKSTLSKDFKILDDSVVESAAKSAASGKNIFNLSTEEAQNLGKAIGCNFFIIQKSQSLRRVSLSRPFFYESYAVTYLVSSRTGRLVFWKLSSFEAVSPAKSEKNLLASVPNLAIEIAANLKAATEKEINEPALEKISEMPDQNSAEAKNFRAPLPFRRLKPEYTDLANLYNVAATVDAAVALDDKGNVLRVEIARWAGYGLDESVARAIRQMQWRAAERDGKTLPIRILLRYNFKKLNAEDDEP